MWGCRNAVVNSRIMENSIFGKRLAMKLSAGDKMMPGFEVSRESWVREIEKARARP